MSKYVNINSLDGDFGFFRYYLSYTKENTESIYCKSPLYGDRYRIEKKTSKVFCNGKKIADTCDYEVI